MVSEALVGSPKKRLMLAVTVTERITHVFGETCIIGDIPNKYPLYKVYMGLSMKGTIPRVPPFSL